MINIDLKYLPSFFEIVIIAKPAPILIIGKRNDVNLIAKNDNRPINNKGDKKMNSFGCFLKNNIIPKNDIAKK